MIKLKGELFLPGDKSISHRSAIFASLFSGKSIFKNFARNADCLATLNCLENLGISYKFEDDSVIVIGNGKRGYKQPSNKLNAENSGTGIRLLSGVLAAQNFPSTIEGDEHLNKRPMGRIIKPLSLMGANIISAKDDVPPLSFIPQSKFKAIEYSPPVASAQVKSCILLAGLFAEGETVVTENIPTRDHTERMLNLKKEKLDNGGQRIFSNEDVLISDLSMVIPGDMSSASFFIIASFLLRGSELIIKDVSLNPTRIEILSVLEEMGAKFDISVKQESPEPMGDVFVKYQPLKNISISGRRIPFIIDEIPILSILASQSEGTFEVKDAAELRVKETDRIKAICDNLKNLGVKLEEFDDGFSLGGQQKINGGKVLTGYDHRIAMSFKIANLVSTDEINLDNPECISVSFPTFTDELDRLLEKR